MTNFINLNNEYMIRISAIESIKVSYRKITVFTNSCIYAIDLNSDDKISELMKEFDSVLQLGCDYPIICAYEGVFITSNEELAAPL